MQAIANRLRGSLGRSASAPAGAMGATRPDLVACEECDAVYRRGTFVPGDLLRCDRCGSVLERTHRIQIDGHLALSAAGLLVFIMANVSDIVTLDLRGVRSPVSLYESIWFTWLSGEHLVALLAAVTAFVFPLVVILLRLYVLAPMAAGRRVAGFIPAMRVLRGVTRWSMVEVFLLGSLIAIVRSAGLASVIPGVGIFSFAVLTVLMAANHNADFHALWRYAERLPA
jgi:paraquat-inducible protein A